MANGSALILVLLGTSSKLAVRAELCWVDLLLSVMMEVDVS